METANKGAARRPFHPHLLLASLCPPSRHGRGWSRGVRWGRRCSPSLPIPHLPLASPTYSPLSPARFSRRPFHSLRFPFQFASPTVPAHCDAMGTMDNLISVLAHCDARGSEAILGDNSHIHVYEVGGISTLGGVHPRTVPNNPDGTMDVHKIVAAIRSRVGVGALHYPTTRLICLENTHGNSGGKCLSVEYTDKVGEVAKSHGLKLHIDGARIFNASVALGVPVDRLVRAADSVSVCLSKGLGAPVGSVIVGSKDFIHKAKILRKAVGGGMRQVGVLCAAAEVGVRDIVGKLADDHRKAKVLAEGLKKIKQFMVDLTSVETNMVFFDMADPRIAPAKLCELLKQRNVLAMPASSKSIRLVVHYQISDSDIQYTLTCIEEAVEEILTVHDKLEHLTNGATTADS